MEISLRVVKGYGESYLHDLLGAVLICLYLCIIMSLMCVLRVLNVHSHWDVQVQRVRPSLCACSVPQGLSLPPQARKPSAKCKGEGRLGLGQEPERGVKRRTGRWEGGRGGAGKVGGGGVNSSRYMSSHLDLDQRPLRLNFEGFVLSWR